MLSLLFPCLFQEMVSNPTQFDQSIVFAMLISFKLASFWSDNDRVCGSDLLSLEGFHGLVWCACVRCVMPAGANLWFDWLVSWTDWSANLLLYSSHFRSWSMVIAATQRISSCTQTAIKRNNPPLETPLVTVGSLASPAEGADFRIFLYSWSL